PGRHRADRVGRAPHGRAGAGERRPALAPLEPVGGGAGPRRLRRRPPARARSDRGPARERPAELRFRRVREPHAPRTQGPHDAGARLWPPHVAQRGRPRALPAPPSTAAPGTAPSAGAAAAATVGASATAIGASAAAARVVAALVTGALGAFRARAVV